MSIIFIRFIYKLKQLKTKTMKIKFEKDTKETRINDLKTRYRYKGIATPLFKKALKLLQDGKSLQYVVKDNTNRNAECSHIITAFKIIN